MSRLLLLSLGPDSGSSFDCSDCSGRRLTACLCAVCRPSFFVCVLWGVWAGAIAALTEIVLSSGLRVVLKPTDFLDDDLQFSAYAWQGISQLPEERLIRGRLARTVAEELGWAGIPREDLLDLLAGLRLSANPSIGAYNRSVSGDCSPTDLVPLLQLARRLFSCTVKIDEDAMDRCGNRFSRSLFAFCFSFPSVYPEPASVRGLFWLHFPGGNWLKVCAFPFLPQARHTPCGAP